MKEHQKSENYWRVGNMINISIHYHYNIVVKQQPPTLKTIIPFIHLKQKDDPQCFPAAYPLGVKVRLELVQEERSDFDIVATHYIWVEQAPPEVTSLNIHLDIEQYMPKFVREIEDRSLIRSQVIHPGEEPAVMEAPKINMKKGCDELGIWEVKPQMLTRGTQTESKYFTDSQDVDSVPDSEITNLLKQLDALGKIFDWVKVVSQVQKCRV